MITPLSIHQKILCRTLLHAGQVCTMRLVDIPSGIIEPFTLETHSTIFEDAPVILLPSRNITDFLLDDLDMFAKRANPLKIINDYLSASGLYFNHDEVITPESASLLRLRPHRF